MHQHNQPIFPQEDLRVPEKVHIWVSIRKQGTRLVGRNSRQTPLMHVGSHGDVIPELPT